MDNEISQISCLSQWPNVIHTYPGLAHGWPGYAWTWIQLFESGLIDDQSRLIIPGILRRLRKDLRCFYTPEYISPLIGFGAVPLVAALISKHDKQGQELLTMSFDRWLFLCEHSHHTDVMMGHAGALLACAEIEIRAPGKVPRRLLKMLWKRCVSQTEKMVYGYKRTPVYLGFSHGLAGFLFVLETGRAIFGFKVKSNLLLHCQQLIWQERIIATADSSAWPQRTGEVRPSIHGWCHGAPSIGLGMLGCYRLTGRKDYWSIAKAALNGTYILSTGVRSFCCGAAGRSQILIEAYRLTRDHQWLQKSAEIFKREIKGIHFSRERFNRGFHIGRLGINYLQIRSSCPDLLSLPALGILSVPPGIVRL